MKSILLFFVMLCITVSMADAQSLMANYPLTQNGNDTTGQNDPMMLNNVVFENGGVYSNGIYYGDDTTGSEILTPPFPVFDYNNFTVLVDFYIDSYKEVREPIIIGGLLWRWIGAFIDDTKLAFMANDFLTYDVSDIVVPPDHWNKLRFSYSKDAGLCYFYFNNELVSSYEISEFNSGDDPRFGNSHTGVGETFKGYWRNLVFYNAASPEAVQNISSLSDITVNTRGDELIIDVPYSQPEVVMSITGLRGRSVKTVKLSAGFNTIDFSLAEGIYLVSFTNDRGAVYVKKVVKR